MLTWIEKHAANLSALRLTLNAALARETIISVLSRVGLCEPPEMITASIDVYVYTISVATCSSRTVFADVLVHVSDSCGSVLVSDRGDDTGGGGGDLAVGRG